MSMTLWHGRAGKHSSHPMVVDPVCGMRVSSDSPHRYAFEGREWVFCSTCCHEGFVADPAKFTNTERSALDTVAKAADGHPPPGNSDTSSA